MKQLFGTATGVFAGGAGGAAIGAHAGIAMLGTAVSGTWPFALAGAAILGLVGNRIGVELEKYDD